jgi:hypothetical protein
VRQSLKDVMAQQGFMNIQRCLETLEKRIWGTMHVTERHNNLWPGGDGHDPGVMNGIGEPECSINDWVRMCFLHDIRPVLA